MMAMNLTTVPAVPPPKTLEELAGLSSRELATLYRAARTPSVAEMAGDLVGRMLAVEGARPFWSRRLRAFAAWRHFPWRGKSFTTLSENRGEGINRVFSDSKPARWFRFETFVGPSRAGKFDALQLDYDNPRNPFFIRAIKDEVREVSAALYLGQAYLVTKKSARLVLYFGLQKP